MMTWSGFGRRLARFALLWVGLVVILPLVAGVILAIAVGGWPSVVIAFGIWAGLAALLVLASRFGLRTWRPVKSLIDTAGKLSDGDYSARVEASDSVPLRPVIHSFNRMAERLERSEEDRRSLLADVGHELRTPLTIIRAELEAIADGVRRPGEVEIRRLLDDIAVMEHLLDDLQTLSTAEAGMLRIHPEPTELVHLVHEVVERHRATAMAGGVALSIELETADSTIDAEVDSVRVREIVGNVLANAIRATPAGGKIDVRVATTGQSSSQETILIEVVDTGRGLSPAAAERAFDRFHKGPESDGTGLGLTISRNLAIAHGGEITLDSKEGLGTTVSIRLPLGPHG